MNKIIGTIMENLKISIIVGILIIIGIGWFLLSGPKSNIPLAEIPFNQKINYQAPNISLTRTEVPKDVKVPEVGEKVAAGVAVPALVSNAAAGASSKYRIFNISAQNDLYNPSTIIVKVGDTVHINFTAVDRTYDITFPDYGMKQVVDKGKTKILEFQAIGNGKFTYYCSLCGGLSSKTIGYIIVAP